MLTLARTRAATALATAIALVALAAPVALAAGKSCDHKPAGVGGGKRVR
jgi:uncharacterized membrane protein